MPLKNYLILIHCIIFYNECKFSIAKALIGNTVRLAGKEEFSYIVAIKRYNIRNPKFESDHEGTGSLVTKKDILTVSHTIESILPQKYEIVVGSVDLRNGIIYDPYWWINRVQWCILRNVAIEYEVNDIAIIRLFHEVPDDIIPVIILPLSPNSLNGAEIIVAGWGMTNRGHINRYMETADLKVLSKDICEYRLTIMTGHNGYLPSNIICTVANPPVIITPGNSGGPVLFMGGLVALQKGTCPKTNNIFNRNLINLNLSIQNFTDFIQSIISI